MIDVTEPLPVPEGTKIPGISEFMQWWEEAYKDMPITKGAEFFTQGMRGLIVVRIHYLQDQGKVEQ